MNVLMRIHTDTAIRGEFVKAGEVVEVDPETALRLAIRGDVVTREQLAAEDAAKQPPETNPDVTQHGDPEPETRDPKPKKTGKT